MPQECRCVCHFISLRAHDREELHNLEIQPFRSHLHFSIADIEMKPSVIILGESLTGFKDVIHPQQAFALLIVRLLSQKLKLRKHSN
eukprot:scaffold644035_cov20-Prasinocladus_malaysianus.AAC.1